MILKLDISSLSVPAFIEKCRAIIAAMTGNANFTTPTPPLTDITAALDALEETYQEGILTRSIPAKVLQKEQRATANALMMLLKSYVEATVGDDLVKAQSSGMEPRKDPEPHNTIDVPQNLRAFTNGVAGLIHLSWSGVKNRKGYLVYSALVADLSDESKWTLLGTTGQLFFDAVDLTRGTEYAFFVKAVGTRNVISGPSEPAVAMAA
jgi:hypothetical protein